jgi:hypothetical protein
MGDEEFIIDEQENEQETADPVLLGREEFLNSIRDDNDPIGDIRWVFHALGARDLTPKEAPSSGAWNLLQTLRKDDLALKSFYTQVYPKLLPTRAQMEKGDLRAEDGRKQFDLIERLLREPDDDAPVLSDVEKRAVENGTRQLELSATGS